MTTAQAVAALERVIVAASQSEFSAQTIQAARDALDFLLAENQILRESKQHESARAHSLLHRGVTLATLCDMVLGEDATDRSDDALVRAVGELQRERDAAQDNALRAANLGAEWKERAERYKNERDAAIEDVREMIGEMEHESNTQHAAALDLQAQHDAAVADARALAKFIDYHCVEDVPDALTREVVNKYIEPAQ